MIQLRIKTEYSFGQTFAPIDRVINRLKEIGCTAAGIVDTSTWGHVAWFDACTAAGIRPLLGVEAFVSDDEEQLKMWFLARTTDGLAELYRATSKSYQQKMPTKFGSVPRLYRDDIRHMSNQIIKFAGDVVDEKFLQEVDAVIDLNPASRILNTRKIRIAEKTGLVTISTSDNAYSSPGEEGLFEVISKSGRKSTPQWILDDLDHQDEAALIADACRNLQLPVAPMVHVEGDLEQLCRQRGPLLTPPYEKRLQYELDLIRQKNFESYFIIVADMVRYAKQHMLVGPSRGSAAGSLVCYLSKITEIDPIPPGLYFERFIDVSRTDMPDIDLDFPDNKRQMIIDYMVDKYGVERVAHIGTVGQYRAKSALVQVCKSVGIPPSATGSVKAAITTTLHDAFTNTASGQDFIRAYPHAAAAAHIEGHASHTGVHAAGILVSSEDITDYATVDSDGIAHIDKVAAERLGLLKIDVLGLRTLTVIEEACELLQEPPDLYQLPLDDPDTYKLFESGRYGGIFQFEGNAMRRIAANVPFETIDDIDAVTALARPGPMQAGLDARYIERRNGREEYASIHPSVETIMQRTYGLPIYQEQTMAIVREIGGFDWKDTTGVRKAIAKSKGEEAFAKYYGPFLAGAKRSGLSEKQSEATWKGIVAMGGYQMNKAHTYSYAVVSYWTAYLKAHHPLEFACATLRNAKDDESAVSLLREIVKEGVEYVAFDIDRSQMNWTVQNGMLYGGFLALNGIGESKAAKLIEARDAGMLSKKQIDDIKKATNIFSDIFPLQRLYAELYDDKNGRFVANDVVMISQLEEGMRHGIEHVFIAELLSKTLQNTNSEVNVKKRGGKIETGSLDYLDLRFADDSGQIGGRIGRHDFKKIGKELLDNVPVGAHLLIRARFINGIRYAFVKKWMRLDGER